MNRAVFLDRDGVVIEDYNYVYKLKDLKLIPRSVDAIKLLNENQFLIIIVTNQAGIAKGYFLEKDALLFNKFLKKKLCERGAKIDAIFLCPHHPDAKVAKYRKICECRKPKTGMLKKASNELDIDLTRSFVVGDKKTDIQSGKYAGCKTILVLTGSGTNELKKEKIECDFIAKDLYDATDYILQNSENRK